MKWLLAYCNLSIVEMFLRYNQQRLDIDYIDIILEESMIIIFGYGERLLHMIRLVKFRKVRYLAWSEMGP